MASPITRQEKLEHRPLESKPGIDEIKELLRSHSIQRVWRRTTGVYDVQFEPRYQQLGIDLIWGYRQDGKQDFDGIEVRCDRNFASGNFLFETTADARKQSPGSFLTSQADYLAYIFPEVTIAYLIPLARTRNWLLPQLSTIPTRKLQHRRNGDTRTSEGHLVRIRDLLHDIPEVRVFYHNHRGHHARSWRSVALDRYAFGVMRVEQD